MKLKTETICETLNVAAEVVYRAGKLTDEGVMAPVRETVVEQLGSNRMPSDQAESVRLKPGKVEVRPMPGATLAEIQNWLAERDLIPAMAFDDFVEQCANPKSAAQYVSGICTVLSEITGEKVEAGNLQETLRARLGDRADEILVQHISEPRLQAASVKEAAKEFRKPRKGRKP